MFQLEIRPNKQWWIKLGEEVSERLRKRTKSGKGLEGSFKSYTADYKKNKAAGKYKRQSSTSTKPDLTLTGDMLRDLQVRGASRSGVQIGWTGSFAERVVHNQEMGREITSSSKALPKELQNYILNRLDKEVGRKIKKQSGKTTVIKVGV